MLTDTEEAQVRQDATQKQVIQTAKNLLDQGMAFGQVAEILSLTEEQKGQLRTEG